MKRNLREFCRCLLEENDDLRQERCALQLPCGTMNMQDHASHLTTPLLRLENDADFPMYPRMSLKRAWHSQWGGPCAAAGNQVQGGEASWPWPYSGSGEGPLTAPSRSRSRSRKDHSHTQEELEAAAFTPREIVGGAHCTCRT